MVAGDRLGHYTIVSLLGAGGMGSVYRATDTTLGRDVALKVLPPEVASSPDRLERFRREARALASLNHPHIVTVYSVEHIDGTHFLTMELVTGKSLDHLINGRPLPLDRVLIVGNAVTDALHAAHERGIVHRDLKPANVILNDSGQVKVLDFGLAKMQSGIGPATQADATCPPTVEGIVLGTPAYMSPEQISGVVDLDRRTDIFSLGVLLYEMATGTRPFKGQSSADLAASILRDFPRPVSEIVPAVPRELASAIARCMEKNAAARFSTMADVRAALQQRVQVSADETPSIAVIPFQNLSVDPENEFFSDGLAEEILNALAHIDGLRVAARTSSFSFRGKSANVGEIGTTLKVATVLEGSVRRAGNRVRVTVQLVDVGTGFQRWSERYDREMADIFDVQEEIARSIAEKLKVTLTTKQSARLVKRPTENLEAYDLHLRGRVLLLKRGKTVAEATACFRRAVDLDPGFAAAWAALADAYTVAGYYGQATPGTVMPKALGAARRSVHLDPDLAEGHCAMAIALLLWERDYDGADAAFRRCIELNPRYTQGRCWHALFNLQWVRGRADEAVLEARRAVEFDPLSAYASAVLALTLATAGLTGEGLEYARAAVQREPDTLITNWAHGLVARWHGLLEESLAALQACMAVSDRHSMPLAGLAETYAVAGNLPEARAVLREMQTKAALTYVSKSTLMIAAAAAGERDLAIEYANEACDERDPVLILNARTNSDAHRLRDDPRFAEVVRRLRLPQ